MLSEKCVDGLSLLLLGVGSLMVSQEKEFPETHMGG